MGDVLGQDSVRKVPNLAYPVAYGTGGIAEWILRLFHKPLNLHLTTLTAKRARSKEF
jgi:hypothetical protein